MESDRVSFKLPVLCPDGNRKLVTIKGICVVHPLETYAICSICDTKMILYSNGMLHEPKENL